VLYKFYLENFFLSHKVKILQTFKKSCFYYFFVF